MPLRSYGVLKGKAIEVRLGAGQTPHYQVRIIDDTTDYRIAINVKSQLAPSEVEYLIVERFQHPMHGDRRSVAARASRRSRATPAVGRARLHPRQPLRPRRRCGRCRSTCPASTTT